METTLYQIDQVSKVIYAVLGIVILLIVMTKNRVRLFPQNRLDSVKLLIILPFTFSLFGILGYDSLYKYMYSLFLIVNLIINFHYDKKLNKIYFAFGLLTLMFVVSFLSIPSNVFDSLIVYLSLATSLFLLIIFTNSHFNINVLKTLIKDVILIQVAMSILKLLIIGRNEALVGTVGLTAGSIATVFPVLALIFLWRAGYIKNSKYLLLWILLLSLLAIANNKRAYWFIMPVIILYIGFYKEKMFTFRLKKILIWLPIIFLIFYVGVRLNPTLNPEKRVGGEFNFEFVWNYTQEYAFAEEKTAKSGLAHGTMSAINITFENIFENITTKDNLLGKGVDVLHDLPRDEQDILRNYGYINRGVMTGFTRKYVSLGLIGLIFFVIYIIQVIKYTKGLQVHNLLLFFVLVEFILYPGVVFLNWGTTTLFIYIIVYERNNYFYYRQNKMQKNKSNI